ncbi:MAG TPA: fatty acid desaturase [Bacteroidia bacterium]|jgi:omega-6 fatty acid desaturase (delta-12 desaturase)|nr:fatty acid desaturase [Bacteroidia bacterium]
MLTGKELILATRDYAKEDRALSWFHLLSTLFLMIGAYAGTFLVPFIAGKLICSILAPLLTIRMFVIYHDFEHHAILNKSIPAKVIMWLFGIFTLAPVSIWKRSHDYHHKHNSKLFSSSIGSYLIITKEKYLSLSRGEQIKYLISRHPLVIFFGYFTMFLYGISFRSFINNPRKHYDSLIALVIHITVTVLVIMYAGWQVYLLSMFIPFFISGFLGDYLFYAQHNFPGVFYSDHTNWSYEKAAMESSSYLKMNPVMQWFTANIGLHHIHHLNSRIPFYRLPEVMKHFPELQNPRKTSLSFKDIAACLRLKVWDPEQGKMIGVAQLN